MATDFDRKVYHGVQIFYVPIDKETGAFKTPIQWYGASTAEDEIDSDATNIYKDNRTYYTATGSKVRKLELEFAQILPEFAIDCLGDQMSREGIHVRDVSGFAPGAFMILTDVYNDTQKTKTELIECYYNCKPAEVPTIENSTNEEEITENPYKVTLDCTANDNVKDKQGRPCDYYWIEKTNENKDFFESFKTAILKPTYTASKANVRKNVDTTKERGDERGKNIK